MALSSMKSLVRRSIQKKQIGSAVASSQIVTWANEFLTDIMPMRVRSDAKVLSYKDHTLKIATKTGATNHFLKGFEEELKKCMEEKFHDITVKQILYVIKHDLNTEFL